MFSAASVCLSVCLFVCPHDLARVRRSTSKVKVTRDKKRKTGVNPTLTMHSRACAVARPYTPQAATDDTIAWPPWGDGLRRWENQRMLSSIFVFYFISFYLITPATFGGGSVLTAVCLSVNRIIQKVVGGFS